MKYVSLKRKLLICAMAGIMGATAITGCSGSTPQESESQEAPEVEAEIVNISEIDATKYITLGDYKSLAVNVLRKEDINDNVVRSYMEYVASAYGSTKEKPDDAAAVLGDTVNIDFEGKLDGVAFDGGTAQGFDLTLGSGQFIAGFEEGLVGIKKGETRDLDLAFPDNYHSIELAGKPVVFTVKVNSISAQVTPELNDEFVETLEIEGVKTLEDYKAYTKKRLMEDSDKMYETRLQEALMTALLASSTIKETPKWLVDHYSESRTHQQTTYAEMGGMSLEEYAANYYGCTLEEFETSIRGAARNDANTLLLMKGVADTEGLSITESEVEDLIKYDIEQGGFASEEELMDYSGYQRLDYEASAIKRKVMEVLKSTAVITEVDSYDAQGITEGHSPDDGHNH